MIINEKEAEDGPFFEINKKTFYVAGIDLDVS